MDPSKVQSDADNDVNSLENTEGAAPQESAPKEQKPEGPKKAPLLKRLWQRLNIYFLLFLLLIVIAGGVTAIMFMRSRAEDPSKTQITSQGLSEGSLEQLANSDTTVGSPKQILNIASNAIFQGSVLMRSNLEVAGAIKVGGDLSLPGITVSGNSKLGEVEANSLAVGGPTTVTGTLTAKQGLSVTGRTSIAGELAASQLTTGSLQLNGDLKLTHHITAGGPIPAIARGNALGGGGTASLSGSDTAGSIALSTGNAPPAGCFMTVTFQKAFANTPHIIVSPVGSAAGSLDYYINRSTSNFSICTNNAAPAGATFGFDYFAVD